MEINVLLIVQKEVITNLQIILVLIVLIIVYYVEELMPINVLDVTMLIIGIYNLTQVRQHLEHVHKMELQTHFWLKFLIHYAKIP